MNKLLKIMDKILSVVLSALIAFLAIGVISTVFLRYFFGFSSGAFEEYLTMSFVITCFIGSALSVREKQHISISYFVDKLTGRRKTVSEIVVMVAIIVVSSVVLIYSIRWIMAVGSTISPVSGVKKGFYYIVVPFSSVLTIFYCVIDILGHFINIEPAVSGYFGDDRLPENEEAN
jgi:TRAP-type C4-dicarboxylate transport system, small permease component